MSTISRPPIHRWTHEDWERMVRSGALEGQRVELMDGEIIDMAPQRDIHAVAVSLAFKAIWRAMGDEVWVRCQLPLRVGNFSEPEPDVSVVPGVERDYIGTGHPREALLVIEVSDSSLAYDRRDKASLYASAGIGDYWIINLNERQVEVYRQPVVNAGERFGFGYGPGIILKAGEGIAPLAAGERRILVADLLP